MRVPYLMPKQKEISLPQAASSAQNTALSLLAVHCYMAYVFGQAIVLGTFVTVTM